MIQGQICLPQERLLAYQPLTNIHSRITETDNATLITAHQYCGNAIRKRKHKEPRNMVEN